MRFGTSQNLAFGVAVSALLILWPAVSPGAQSTGYAADSIVIPMDTTYQDYGMFKAYGLVYKLLQNGIVVDWAIKSPKNYGDTDFSATTMRTITSTGFGATTFAADYRGGPFVVDSAYYAQALPIIQAWIGTYPTVAAHRADSAFTANLNRRLYAAPTIAVFLDGAEDIAFDYLNAASIPMSTGGVWPPDKAPTPAQCPVPNCMSENQIAGTLGSHPDGALLDSSGRPTVCQVMSMHYDPKAGNYPTANAVAWEMRDFLTGRPVHAFFECAAIEWFEILSDAGPFVTTNRMEVGTKPTSVDYQNSARPFAQADGPFVTQGGSMPAMKLAPGSAYYFSHAVMVKQADAAEGVNDVWVTDYLDGNIGNGKISFLGAHRYKLDLPISTNGGSQGTRYFLDSLFEAPCASEAVSTVTTTLSGPAFANQTRVQYTVHYAVTGGYAYNTTITLPLPGGVSFSSASNGGTFSGGTVTWSLGTKAAGDSGNLTVDVDINADGS